MLILLVLSLLAFQHPQTPTAAVALHASPQETTPPKGGAGVRSSKQRLVESIEIRGNRRLRSEDLLNQIQTRAGDVFNPARLEADFQALLALHYLDKTRLRMLTRTGPRGGVIVIFDIKELPIIRDVQFEGLKSISETDVFKGFREKRVGITKERILSSGIVLDPVKLNKSKRVVKEMLAAAGHPHATVDVRENFISPVSTVVTYVVNEHERVRVAEIRFAGNHVFSSDTLRDQMRYVKETARITDSEDSDILDTEKLDADLNNIKNYMRSEGYLQARTGEPRVEEISVSAGQPQPGLPESTDKAVRITIPVVEGKLYRVGELKIEGNSIFPERVIRNAIGIGPGDIASGERIYIGLFEDLKRLYASRGFIQYSPEPDVTYRDNPENPGEGIADFSITIDEGKPFEVLSIQFTGTRPETEEMLREAIGLHEGDLFNQSLLEENIKKINQLGLLMRIDADRDMDMKVAYDGEGRGLLDITIRVHEKAEQAKQ